MVIHRIAPPFTLSIHTPRACVCSLLCASFSVCFVCPCENKKKKIGGLGTINEITLSHHIRLISPLCGSATMLLFQEEVGQSWLPIFLLLCAWCPALGQELDPMQGDWDDWGSGLQDLLLTGFPADSPFVSETPDRPVNCSQRFWLPPPSPVCWDDVVGQEEFEQTRLLALQNRAALQAVSVASGMDEGGPSYDEQARQDVQMVQADHREVVETAETMEKVFFSLEEKRRGGTEHYTFSR